MRMSFRQTAFATTAIVALIAFPAAAASPGAGDPTAVRPASQAGVAPAQPGPGGNREATVEQRISDLHAKLQITAAQQPQWDQFAQVMRDNAQSIDEAFQHRVQALPSLTAAENLQSYAQVAAEHAQETQKLVPVFQALYDVLTENQKHRADQVFREDATHGKPSRHG